MDSFSKKLSTYALLAVEVGVNVQKGQHVVVNASTEVRDFVRLIVKHAYEKGAKHVTVNWQDDEVSRLKYELAPPEAFDEYPEWEAKGKEALAEKGAAFISVVSSSPDLLKGIESKRIAAFQKAAGKALHTYRQYIQSDKVSWTVIGAASAGWASKVFPGHSEEEAIQLLWEEIFNTTRVNEENPVQAWKEHDQTLHEKVDHLNAKHYSALHYQAEGTDLTIELPKKHVWAGAGSINENGNEFMANMPTEEVFTLPQKDGVNGTVSSTKPLSYGGNIIDNFTLTFKNGRIVDIKAEKGEDILKELVETDEGSHYLGEVALVPYDSPISKSDILFFNTLFDENASNHLAIGSAYAFNIEGGKQMSREELVKEGLNESITHVDFMIGSKDMSIDGITADGKREPVFRNGNWAF
ncbi:thermophilic metalloprotease family protein [Bacillus atrophaeus subsp. globigii]|uniref:Aminopeptidase n=2 Tax=Bacillus atrophaeus TaxID=1452 RepID=A0ABM5LW09_BACA1|nr:aminopeptidase [Bacillus atrophaeus]AMR63129.1 peptidase M29 [Bacillus subtilis subsp. globigii]ADP31952.1 aminopeptidase [Bacillus atrophaeus 1942]AIK46834.1 thermophilic metalloprotease family protein [Bacillus atrophaeus subsp. globigii]KFK83343.1 thermophilic metalloprotease family protein [Bacillus atrophaeus]MBG9759471.1 peptidase M29 [Bacillus atrophaeus]